MRILAAEQIVLLHRAIIRRTGGSFGIRDQATIETAVAQPRMSFAGTDLYASIAAKAAAMAHTLISGHPFVDGNKRIGHATLETTLVLNDLEISASVDEQERVVLAVAAGQMARDEFIAWVESHTVRR